MSEILHARLPDDVFDMRPLPNIRPVSGPWLWVDEAYAAQMAYREALMAERRDAVLAEPAEARDASNELLDHVLDALPGLGFSQSQDLVGCPDGRDVVIDRDAPLATLGRLVQCDFCLHDKVGAEHVLKAAVLCFPASWTLAEKVGRPLRRIHKPVDAYDAGLAKRVQRLFDCVQPGRPLWRFNRLFYADPDLYQPLAEAEKGRDTSRARHYVRVERQTVLRLPGCRWVVFAIHTYVLPLAATPFVAPDHEPSNVVAPR